MDDWKKFSETLLPRKDDFYSNLNMEDIKDSDCNHVKKFCKDFEIKNIGKSHNLYFKSDTLLLADVFENFGKIRLEIYEIDRKRETERVKN